MKFRRMVAVFIFLFLITGIFTSWQIGFGKEKQVDTRLIYNPKNYKNDYDPSRVIVGLKEGVRTIDFQRILGNIYASQEELTKAKTPPNLKQKTELRKIWLVKLRSKDKRRVLESIKRLKNDKQVAYAEPDYKMYARVTNPNDTDFNRLYGINRINAPRAWDVFTGDPTIVVGVIDSGIDYLHPDLVANIWKNLGEIQDNGIDDDSNGYIDDVYGWDFVHNVKDPMDDCDHGTHVAGIIAAVGNNSTGVVGVTWKAKLVALKYLNAYAFGLTSNAVKAVDYAYKMGIPIINASWSGGAYSQSLKDAIAIGGLFIAAAGNQTKGNDNDITPQYPSSYDCDNIIAVAATDKKDKPAVFSNYGKTSVDIAAPGVDIWSCQPGSGYQYLSGTSMAAPYVSGAAALLKGYKSTLSTPELKKVLLDSVDKLASLNGKVVSGGRLNLYKALMLLR